MMVISPSVWTLDSLLVAFWTSRFGLRMLRRKAFSDPRQISASSARFASCLAGGGGEEGSLLGGTGGAVLTAVGGGEVTRFGGGENCLPGGGDAILGGPL